MFRTYMKYSALLIGLYLGLTHATQGGNLIKAGANGAATVDKALQGR
jgi:hypothetical protein